MAAEGQVIGCHTQEEFNQHHKRGVESKKPVVIDFTASWCPPCRFIAPIFVELAKKYPDVIFLKVDVDELKDVASEYEVEAMPTFVFLKEGKVVDRVVGADKAELEKKIAELAASTASTASA